MDENHAVESTPNDSNEVEDDSERSKENGKDDAVSELNTTREDQFKKPQLLFGPLRGKGIKSQKKTIKIVNDSSDIASTNDNNAKPIENKPLKNESKNINNPNDRVDENQSKSFPPIPYEEPDWGGSPPHGYKLEELKSGTIVKTIELTNSSFSVFGRLENCDIPMLHPTVSRYHAVLQYRHSGDEHNEPGFYIYDLGSSLGTFLNKQKLRPKTYVRVKVGHVLKLACSTRMFILQGPADDEEPESELTVTELKQQYQEKLAALEAEKARLEAEEEERKKKEEDKGIDWGMGEDADEETDLTENPYASTQNEELFLDDPKKTLRGWFEREGEELVYDVEEKGFGHFVCRIELPVDNGGGGNLIAEASVKGKKKEAVVQAALEACRLLDRQGLLRQATQESKKRLAKDWEANDFYDSDEDNFLDRTGQIEKKRQQRMAQSGKIEQVVETYDTLVKKYDTIVQELEQSENKLNEMLTLATKMNRHKDEEDDLDVFMNNLSHVPADKIEIKRMKAEVSKLRSEEERVRKLVNTARPTELPKLKPAVKPSTEKKIDFPHGIIGKKAPKKRTHQEILLPRETTQQQLIIEDVGEEFDEDDDKLDSRKIDTDEIEVKEAVVSKKKKSRTDTRNRQKKTQVLPLQVDDEDYSTCTWTPPAGQTGDGRTSLNDKFGY